MEPVPDLLVRGLLRRDALPNPVAGNDPSTTTTIYSMKITHALTKLAQAGVVDDSNGQVIQMASTTSTIHAEKITHATEKLTQAGLSNDTTQSGHHFATKYIIIIAVVSAVALLALLTGGCLCWRRYKKRRAYNIVSRGADNKGKSKSLVRDKQDLFNADMQEKENFDVGIPKITVDRSFESGYDSVNTGYDGSDYGGSEPHGDKRAQFEA
jgi:hypothetical protein